MSNNTSPLQSAADYSVAVYGFERTTNIIDGAVLCDLSDAELTAHLRAGSVPTPPTPATPPLYEGYTAEAQTEAARVCVELEWVSKEEAAQELEALFANPDPEPQAGAERRAPTPPKPRIEFGAELQGGLVNILVPSDSNPEAVHVVTCRRVKSNGVELYAGLDCTCEDFAYRKRKTALNPNMIPAPCKHIKAAQAFARKQAVERIFTQGIKR